MTLEAVPDEPTTATGYHFDATCPNCAGPLIHIRSVVVAKAVRRALLLCSSCRRRWIITVTMRPERKDET